MMNQTPKGKPVRFDTLKVGKALIRLDDGNYLECVLNVLKITKLEGLGPDGNPVYAVMTNVATAYWKKEEMAQLDEKSSKEEIF